MDNTEISLSFKNNVTGDKKLKEYEQRLQNIYALLNGINNGQAKELAKVESKSKDLNGEMKNTDKLTKQLSNDFDMAFNIGKLAVFTRATGILFKTMMKLVSVSSNYVENINLLEVAYANINKKTGAFNEDIEVTSERIEKLVNHMADVYGFDESRLARSFGIFKQMANAMNLPNETAEKLSEHLVKMSNDIASLYNLPLDRAENALQSALAGQVRPIRSATGADITEKTLQNTVDTLGLDRSISELSYVEKRLVMIISLTDQLKNSQGDYGRTIESVSNQIRVMKEQWQRLARAVGNIFYPILEKVLPYLNAVLMVLTEIFNLVATLLGFKMPEFDYSGLSGASDYAIDLADGLDNASKSADKLKNKMSGLRGFDKLNVISTPKDSSSGGSGAGVDPKIMDAFNNKFDKYNDMMDKVNMKARQIRDKILDWLGFTDKTYTNLKRIAVVLGVIVGLKILKGVSAIFTLIKNSKIVSIVASIFGYFANATAGLKMFMDGVISLDTLMSGLITPVMQVVGGIALIGVGLYDTFKSIDGLVNGTTDKLHGILGIIEGIALVVSGVALLLGAWPVALIAGGVALLAFATKWVVDIWDDLDKTILKPIVDFINGIATTIYEKAIKPTIEFFKPIADAIIEIFALIVKNVSEIVVGVGKAVWSIIEKVVEIGVKIAEIFFQLGKAFYNLALKPIVNILVKAGSWVYDHIISPIYGWLTWIRDKAIGIFKVIGTTVVDFISGLFKSVINGILWVIEKNINGFIKLLNGAIKLINKIPGVNITKVDELKIPRLETGMSFVPKDFYGPVYLDYGERVLTKEENRDYAMNKNNNYGYSFGSQQAQSQPMNATFVIQVGSKEVARQVITDLQGMAKSNGKPITIG